MITPKPSFCLNFKLLFYYLLDTLNKLVLRLWQYDSITEMHCKKASSTPNAVYWVELDGVNVSQSSFTVTFQ